VNRVLKLLPKGATHPALREIIRLELEHDVSIMAVERASGRVVGAAVNSDLTPAYKEVRAGLFQQLMTDEPKWSAFSLLMARIYKDDLFGVLAVDRICDYHYLSILASHQGQKLGRPLAKLSDSRAWEMGFPAAYALATADASKALLSPLGYRVHHEVDFHDVHFQGQPLVADPGTKLRVMVKLRPKKDQI